MRRWFTIAGSGLVLLVALVLLWSFRFERVQSLPTWHLETLKPEQALMVGAQIDTGEKGSVLRLQRDIADRQVVTVFEIPADDEISALHLRYRMNADGLIPGEHDWSDGRVIVEWRPRSGQGGNERVQVSSIRFDDRSDILDMVVPSPRSGDIPMLIFANLGISGDFEISELEISAVRERWVWKVGSVLLVIAWVGWVIVLLRSMAPKLSRWKSLVAAVIWVFFAMQLIVPGPWGIQKSLVIPFLFGADREELLARAEAVDKESSHTEIEVIQRNKPAETAVVDLPKAEEPKSIAPSEVKPEVPAIKPLVKIDDGGSWILQVKREFKKLRPLLHALVLMGPALVLLLLMGYRGALVLSIGLALGIELAQVAYGYGFDRTDLWDLIYDAIGIAAAVLVYWRWEKRLARRADAGGRDKSRKRI